VVALSYSIMEKIVVSGMEVSGLQGSVGYSCMKLVFFLLVA
jgi:hypothetical protein